MKKGDNPYKYPINVLEKRLKQEFKNLKIFEKPSIHMEWKEENTKNCVHRILELKECIEHLKQVKFNGIKIRISVDE